MILYRCCEANFDSVAANSVVVLCVVILAVFRAVTKFLHDQFDVFPATRFLLFWCLEDKKEKVNKVHLTL